MINSIINKIFLMKVYKTIEFFIQYIFIGFIYFITVSAVESFINIQNSILGSVLVMIIFLLLFGHFIIPELKDNKLFGEYTENIRLLICLGTVIILSKTLGYPEITFH